MDEKISLEAIARYSDAYSDKVMRGFFSSRNKITGAEILALSNIQQVNYFIIRELFKAWKDETRKQKSAYFDYENQEVKEALTTFMSVLSNHISIDQEHFAPLLKKAVSQTLMIVFDPYDFYSLLVAGENNALDVTAFREEIKYLKVNRQPLERMLRKVEEKKVDRIQGNEAFAILDQILEEVNFSPEELDPYIEKFSTVLPLDPSTLYRSADTAPVAPVQEVARPNNIAAQEKRVQNHNTAVSPATIHEHLHREKQPALMDNLGKIAKIKDHLTINQKFMFTKVLFYGDFESFSRAVDDLDQLPDMNAAMEYLESHSSSWDKESREFHEFMEMVEKRFS
jgi:hypothetical protein